MHDLGGEGIVFYNWSNNTSNSVRIGQDMKNNILRYNHIYNIRDRSRFCLNSGICSTEMGIAMNSDSQPTVPETVTGNLVHHNILVNIGDRGISRFAFRFKSTESQIGSTWRVLHNVVDGAGNGLELGGQIEFYNNILSNIGGRHVFSWASDNLRPKVAIDNNLYYPTALGAQQFQWGSNLYDFETWKISTGLDQNSISGDPGFADAGNPDPALRDYHLTASSPAIDGGTDTELVADRDGKPFVIAPDIGAYEFGTIAPPGNGLTGEYFNNKNLSVLKLTRVDPAIDFNWGIDGPYPNAKKDNFSVRWSGELLAPSTGIYTFYTQTDDGVRLWVNGQFLVDQWVNQTETEHQGSISLTAGQRVSIKMEYFDSMGNAVARLLWQGPGINKQVVPQAWMYSP
jgi:hypothetical protein